METKRCTVCDEEIETYKVMGCRGKHLHKSVIDSDQGVLFGQLHWFCNDCWNEIIKLHKKRKRKL